MQTEREKSKAERKARYLAKVSSLAGWFDNYDDIMKEAAEKFEKENKNL